MPKSPSPKNKSAWKDALEENNLPELQRLHAQGMDIETKVEADVSHGKLTALQHACFNDWAEGALWLLQVGAKAGGLTKSRCSALSFAVMGGDEELIAALLQADPAPLDVVSVFGDAPIHHAAIGEHEVMRLLLVAGANAALKNDAGKTAVDIARECDAGEMLDVLREAIAREEHAGLDASTAAVSRRGSPARM